MNIGTILMNQFSSNSHTHSGSIPHWVTSQWKTGLLPWPHCPWTQQNKVVIHASPPKTWGFTPLQPSEGSKRFTSLYFIWLLSYKMGMWIILASKDCCEDWKSSFKKALRTLLRTNKTLSEHELPFSFQKAKRSNLPSSFPWHSQGQARNTLAIRQCSQYSES